ncbi:MAG: amidohydrolase family protein [Acidobacteriia bacterium]|nr:amidohydrolase family protein [Terriglobia bacterium]
MAVIDFHNHVYPPEYIEALRVGPSAYKITIDADGNPVLHSPGDYNIAVPAHRFIDVRKSALGKAGVDKQIITLTCPGTVIETPQRSVELSRMVNDCFARIQREHADHFVALGTLPLNDPEASVEELERVLLELKLKGVMVFSNVNGVALSDQRFWPLYQKAHDLEAVFFVHPTYPVGVEAMLNYMLMPLVGFVMDTTLAAASLVFAGVPERFPNMTWVLGHLGGTIPFIAERLDRGYEAFPQCRQNIKRPPSAYLKEFYYDSVNFDVKALQLAIDFAGADHILAGSDFPHLIGSMEKMLSSIRQLKITPEEREGILGGNAARLLRL